MDFLELRIFHFHKEGFFSQNDSDFLGKLLKVSRALKY